MKRYNILFFVLLAVLMQSCLKDDKDIFEGSPSERLQKRLSENRETLLAAPNGWMMKLYPNKSQLYGGYTLFVSFDVDDNVKIMSERGGSEYTESSLYEVLGDDGPVLSFNTYNSLLNYFSDPQNPDGIGPSDGGMQGDYEFKLIDIKSTLALTKGKKTGNRIEMLPLPAGVEWKGMMVDILKISDAEQNRSEYKLIYEDEVYEVSKAHRSFTINLDDKLMKAPFIYTSEGLEFYEPLKIGKATISMMKYYPQDGDEQAYFEDEEFGVKIVGEVIQSQDLVELLKSNLWAFAYSNLGELSKLSWDKWKEEQLDPKGISFLALELGDLNADGSMMGLGFFSKFPSEEKYQYAYFAISFDNLGDDIVKLTYIGATSRANEFLRNHGISLIVSPVLDRTFKLSVDDPFNPKWMKFQDTEIASNSFTLLLGEVTFPYDK